MLSQSVDEFDHCIGMTCTSLASLSLPALNQVAATDVYTWPADKSTCLPACITAVMHSSWPFILFPMPCLCHSALLGRYRVVYRLVNTVYVMAVASAAANVFSLMKLVDAMTRVATVASRGVEVTPEKLSRRYPEVCTTFSLVQLLPLPACMHLSTQP